MFKVLPKRPQIQDTVYPYSKGDGLNFGEISLYFGESCILAHGDVCKLNNQLQAHVMSIYHVDDFFESYTVARVQLLVNDPAIHIKTPVYDVTRMYSAYSNI